jgi:hypothetical protein
MRLLLSALFVLIFGLANAQIAINTNGSSPHPSAMLDVQSYTRGVLVPRMTTYQRTIIKNPATGLLVFDSETSTFWFYNGTTWVEIKAASSPWLPDYNGIYYNSGNVGIGTTPHSTYPLWVRQPNYGNGQAAAVFEADDNWHTAIAIKNNTTSHQFILAVGGVSNLELKPHNFGILNSNLIRWAMVVNGSNNYVGFGAPDVHSPLPKSTIHVFTGDVNIEQIGSGIIMKSPNGSCWRITIDDEGNLVRTPISCL